VTTCASVSSTITPSAILSRMASSLLACSSNWRLRSDSFSVITSKELARLPISSLLWMPVRCSRSPAATATEVSTNR